MSFGKSRAKLNENTKKPITFADVAGYEEVVEELSEIVDFLKTPKKFVQMGARVPKGRVVIWTSRNRENLHGKSGCG